MKFCGSNSSVRCSSLPFRIWLESKFRTNMSHISQMDNRHLLLKNNYIWFVRLLVRLHHNEIVNRRKSKLRGSGLLYGKRTEGWNKVRMEGRIQSAPVSRTVSVCRVWSSAVWCLWPPPPAHRGAHTTSPTHTEEARLLKRGRQRDTEQADLNTHIKISIHVSTQRDFSIE